MKRLTMCYFLLLVCLNVFFALCLSSVIASYEAAIRERFGTALPPPTEWVFQYPWWPWIGVAVYMIGAVLSLFGKPNDYVLRNLLIVFLIVELGVMFVSMMAFNLPWAWQVLK